MKWNDCEMTCEDTKTAALVEQILVRAGKNRSWHHTGIVAMVAKTSMMMVETVETMTVVVTLAEKRAQKHKCLARLPNDSAPLQSSVRL